MLKTYLAILFLAASAVGQTTADDYYRLGKQHMHDYQVNDIAIGYLDKAIELDPKHGEALYSRGWIKWARNRSKDAFNDFTRAIESNPRVAKYYLIRANARGRTFRTDDPRFADYAKAIEVEPSYAATYMSRGLYWLELKNRDAAIADFTRGIEIGSVEPQTRPADFYLHRARVYLDFPPRDDERAVHDLSKVIKLEPRLPWPYLVRSQIFARRGEHTQAATDYKKYKDLSAQQPIIRRGP